jgi:hypothetical protein
MTGADGGRLWVTRRGPKVGLTLHCR